jgi:peptide/nickel transport system permease protein
MSRTTPAAFPDRRSLWMKRPVLAEVMERFKATLLLTASALLLSTLGGIALGIGAATRANSLLDRLSTVASLFGASMPVFWLGIVLMVIFSLWLGWLPASGMYAPYGGGGARDLLAHLVLPALTLAAPRSRSSRGSRGARCSTCSARTTSGPRAPRA